jgi:uncharacterized protein
MILVDSNIPMYLIGSPGTLKTDAQRLVERLLSDRRRLVTDAEVFQEILRRYTSVNRRYDIQRAFDALRAAVDEVFPVDHETVARAKQVILSYTGFPARDAIHIGVMEQHDFEHILSFDSGFDGYPGIKRIS